MTNLVTYRGNNSGRLHSHALWHKFFHAMNNPTVDAVYHFDDFLYFQEPTSGEVNGPYRALDTGDSTLTLATDAPFGALRLLTTTDNEDCGIQLGDTGSGGGTFVIPDNTGEAPSAMSTAPGLLVFECRVKKNVLTDATGGFFVGLADPTALAADFIADAGNDFADNDLLGFWNDETDDSTGSHVHVVTQKTSAAFDTIIDTAYELVADTYVKLGFVYDPAFPVGRRVKFYVDGVSESTFVGENSGDATVYLGDTTNFPGDEEMAPIFYVNSASGNDTIVHMDWWAIGQIIGK